MSQPNPSRQPRHPRQLPPRSRQQPTSNHSKPIKPIHNRHHRTQSSISTAPPPSTASDNSSFIGDNGIFPGQSEASRVDFKIPHSVQTASSVSSTSSFGHIAPSFFSPAQTPHSQRLLAQANRPRQPPVNPINYPLQSVNDTSPSYHQRYPTLPHARGQTFPSYRTQLESLDSTNHPSSIHAVHKSSSLPDLHNIRPHEPFVVEERRRLEDNSTKPFPLLPLPYSDHDVPLPQPYNAAYPHPLTAYASPGVNSAAIKVVKWREALQELMEKDLDRVKGTILAASDRDINPPALMIPVYEGEGCGIPERLWSRFESIGEAQTTSLLSTSQAHLPGAIPPRFAQAGIQVVAIPGSRPIHASSGTADLFPLPAADAFPAVRTNFSNVLRRNSNDTEAGRTVMPGRRPVPQPTPFHKTELCRTWEHEGTCKYGSNCQFAHGFLELRMPVSGMATPPNPFTSLPTRHQDPYVSPTRNRQSYDSPPPPLDHQGSWRTARAPHFDFIGEMDSLRQLHRELQPLGTPAPIGAERAWKTVPVPSTEITTDRQMERSPVDSNSSRRPDTINFNLSWIDIDTETHSSAIPIKAPSSLSASAVSFHSTSPPSLGYSYSTSPTSAFLGSSYPDTQYSGGGYLYTPQSTVDDRKYTGQPSPIGVQGTESDISDWEVLKRSIDATTVRTVW